MVTKDFNTLIQEIKIKDAEVINQKEMEKFTLENLQELKGNKVEEKIKFETNPSKKEAELKNEIKEEPKNEIKIEKEKEKEEVPKEKTQKKKKKNNKKKNKKADKIFEIPKTNPYRNLFDFKEVTKSRFQDNSIFRILNNWEEKECLQTNPPTKDIDEQFPNQIFPQGEIQPYSK